MYFNKGKVSRDEHFWKAYNNKYKVLSVHALIVFKFCCLLVFETIKVKDLACSFEITYQFLKSFHKPSSKTLKRQF
jgi:hypothetical protein